MQSQSAPPAAPPVPTRRLFGIDVAALTAAETAQLIVAWADGPPPRTVITANLDHLEKLRHDAAFRGAYARADLVTADGMPLVWLSRLEGRPLPERVAGSDLVEPIARLAAASGRSLFLLGTTMPRLERAAERLVTASPTLRIAGLEAPPFGFERNPAEEDRLAARLSAADADIVLVALGAPKQELFADRMARRLRHGVFVGVGGSLDFLAGATRRAPPVVRRTGLEWAWRAASEPARLGPRYARIIAALPALWRAHRRDRPDTGSQVFADAPAERYRKPEAADARDQGDR